MKIYTRTGDDGTTGLFGGARVAKNSARVEAYGCVDELNSLLGLARSLRADESFDDGEWVRLQESLFVLGADLSTPSEARSLIPRLELAQVQRLETRIDQMEADLEPLKQFILPSGSPAGSALHLARTVCRRAERAVLTLMDEEGTDSVGEAVLPFLNRLSDYLFVFARFTNAREGREETPWVPQRIKASEQE